MWLVRRYRHTEPPYAPYLRAYDLERGPAPMVAADGIAGINGSQYELVDELPAEAIVTAAPAATGADKPAYRIPSMDEIRAVPWNGLNVVSTFSGAGGSSTGYRMAGYRVLAAVEFVPAAADSYDANKADYTRLLRRDIRGLQVDELLDACGLAAGELDLLDGSPPCEPFSTAGRRERTWNQIREYSGERQRTDDLFYEFARLVDGVKPRAFAAENVTGLARGRARGYFKRILAVLRGCGYRVAARTLDAAWLGVPQHRERIIIVGVREDLDADPVFPAPLAYQYTVRDALPHIGRIGTDPNFDRRRRERLTVDQMMTSSDRPAPTVQTSGGGIRTPGASGVNGLIEERAMMGSFGRYHHPRDITDEVAPTVVGGDTPVAGVRWGVVGYYLETGGRNQAPQRNRIDEPSPAITNGGDGDRAANSTHYQVEEIEGYYRTGTFRERDGGDRRNRLDEPSPTIIAGGHEADYYQLEVSGRTGSHFARERWNENRPAPTIIAAGEQQRVEVEGGVDQQIVGNEAFEPRFGPLEQPHPTITAEGARTSGELRSSVTRVRRRFTIDELKRICGFPDDYALTGSFSQQWERLGDAVPPPMAAAWGRELADGPLAQPRP